MKTSLANAFAVVRKYEVFDKQALYFYTDINVAIIMDSKNEEMLLTYNNLINTNKFWSCKLIFYH